MTCVFSEKDGLRFQLEKRYTEKTNEFPINAGNYVRIFQQIEDYLNRNIHPEVVTGAALHGSGLLNDHGKEHVEMVIQRAGLLLGIGVEQLSGYEIFILLLAIHFHDVGNIFGRDEHEKRVFEVMEELGVLFPSETPLKKTIATVAMAHGGKINGSKDTISSLAQEEHLQGALIKPALLAAILRFSDEISDDHTRAARFLLQSLPPENQIFHYYSKCLQQTGVSGNSLILKFDLPLELADGLSTKENVGDPRGYSEMFLYDEILLRLKKCLTELEYCSRYFRGMIGINSISAEINVHKPHTLNPVFHDKIVLKLSGYPNSIEKDICSMVEKPLAAADGIALQGLLRGDGAC